MADYPARAVVDLEAIRGNMRVLSDRAGAADAMAVVKADAYGHGLLPVARAALEGGASWLATAQLSEALRLRASGITAPILSLLYAPGARLDLAVEAGVDLSVGAPWALAEVAAAARACGRTARVHLEVDTGLGRGGAFPGGLGAVLDAALRAQAGGEVAVVGVWSHLARADEAGHPSVRDQRDTFRDAVAMCERAGAAIEVRHLAASAALLTEPETHFDLVRPGIALYGLSPFPDRADSASLGLRPAMRLEATLSVVKQAPGGQGVSYGHDYVTAEQTRLGVVPIGYADGIPRHASGAGPVQVGGRRLQVAGRICMDQFVVDLGPGPEPHRAGDLAVVFGPGDDGEPTAQDWAEAAGTISYEIVTRLGVRVPREHVGESRGSGQR